MAVKRIVLLLVTLGVFGWYGLSYPVRRGTAYLRYRWHGYDHRRADWFSDLFTERFPARPPRWLP